MLCHLIVTEIHHRRTLSQHHHNRFIHLRCPCILKFLKSHEPAIRFRCRRQELPLVNKDLLVTQDNIGADVNRLRSYRQADIHFTLDFPLLPVHPKMLPGFHIHFSVFHNLFFKNHQPPGKARSFFPQQHQVIVLTKYKIILLQCPVSNIYHLIQSLLAGSTSSFLISFASSHKL